MMHTYVRKHVENMAVRSLKDVYLLRPWPYRHCYTLSSSYFAEPDSHTKVGRNSGNEEEEDDIHSILKSLAAENNMKVAAVGESKWFAQDAEDDEYTWDEIMEELEDPWMMFPPAPETGPGTQEATVTGPSRTQLSFNSDSTGHDGEVTNASPTYSSPAVKITEQEMLQYMRQVQQDVIASSSGMREGGAWDEEAERDRWIASCSVVLLDVRDRQDYHSR